MVLFGRLVTNLVKVNVELDDKDQIKLDFPEVIRHLPTLLKKWWEVE